MRNHVEEVKKILQEALWKAYCSGRANNEYIPEEVLPDLIKRCRLFEGKDLLIPDKPHCIFQVECPVVVQAVKAQYNLLVSI